MHPDDRTRGFAASPSDSFATPPRVTSRRALEFRKYRQPKRIPEPVSRSPARPVERPVPNRKGQPVDPASFPLYETPAPGNFHPIVQFPPGAGTLAPSDWIPDRTTAQTTIVVSFHYKIFVVCSPLSLRSPYPNSSREIPCFPAPYSLRPRASQASRCGKLVRSKNENSL